MKFVVHWPDPVDSMKRKGYKLVKAALYRLTKAVSVDHPLLLTFDDRSEDGVDAVYLLWAVRTKQWAKFPELTATSDLGGQCIHVFCI